MKNDLNTDFIERTIYLKNRKQIFLKSSIIITKPSIFEKDLFICNIIFKSVEKYNTTAKGIDQFHSIECAMAYVNAICRNSDDPEFFINETESMKNFHDGQ